MRTFPMILSVVCISRGVTRNLRLNIRDVTFDIIRGLVVFGRTGSQTRILLFICIHLFSLWLFKINYQDLFLLLYVYSYIQMLC